MGRPLGHPDTLVEVTAGTAATYEVFVVAAMAGISGVVVKYPQSPEHCTAQSTPALVESLMTAAFRLTVFPVSTWVGAEGTKLIVSAAEAVMFTVVDVLTLESAAEVAVIVTVPPVGTKGGAV